MFKFLFKHLERGIILSRNNPQIIYTLFLMLVIPLAFLFSGQRFLSVSTDNQERLEKSGIGLMQDTVVAIAPEKMYDIQFLNNLIDTIQKDNENITEFVISRIDNGRPVIVGAHDSSSVGKIDLDNEVIYRDFEGMMRDKSVIIPTVIDENRQWKAYRDILDSSGNIIGYVLTVVSMKSVDNVAMVGILNAYIFLIFIIALILVLLVRQARIIDYTVLYKRLKDIDIMKDDFLSMAAHELRAPVAIIRGYVDLLSDIKNLGEENAENLRRIDISAKQLSTIIGDILDIARLEQGRIKFEFSETNVNDSIRDIMASFEIIAKDKKLSLSSEIAENVPKIFVDSARFQQILNNLVGNALKYTSVGGVSVKTRFEPLKKLVYIRVSDTGFGISAEDQKGLFGKFYRVKTAETSGIQGTGLGLWITYKLVTEMKGNITVESIKGKGSDFILSFPSVSQMAEKKIEN